MSNDSFMVIDTAALNLVAKMFDNYAAMSHFEFFAEMYALYYDEDDPKRKTIPATVGNWLDDNIGKRDPDNPRRPAARRKPGEGVEFNIMSLEISPPFNQLI